jgi:hypothetical protein
LATRTIETDYLVVGCGATAMAFTDALIAESDADVVMVDRRHAPGGHWNDAYPFVRLHHPSAYYGVNSLPLGSESIERHGPDAGCYERAGAAEICAYYERVMRERLLASGRVRYYPMCEYVGGAPSSRACRETGSTSTCGARAWTRPVSSPRCRPPTRHRSTSPTTPAAYRSANS